MPYDVPNFGAPTPPAAIDVGEYRVNALDTLNIRVFQVEDLTREYQVDVVGNISLPLIGTLPAVGRTLTQLETTIEERLGSRYLRNPEVNVTLMRSLRRNVTVEGAVRQSGVFEIPGPITLIQAVALARGTDENSNPRRVVIFRQIDGQRLAAAFDLTSIRRGEAPDPQIYAGDIVVVAGSNERQIFRDIISTLPVLGVFRPF